MIGQHCEEQAALEGVFTTMQYLCNRHNFSVAKLAQANADIINAVQRLPLSSIYGKGLRAGADGTYVPIFENNLFASHMHVDLRQPSNSVARYAKAHMVKSVVIDGNCVQQG